MPATTTAAVNAELASVPGAGATLKNLGWGLALALIAAVVNFLTSAAPAIVQMVLGFLPSAVHAYAGPWLNSLVLAAIAWLATRAKSNHIDAVIGAKAQEPTQAVRDLYVKRTIEKGGTVTASNLLSLFGAVLISWQYADVPGSAPATGFKVALGTTPGQYTQFVDVPGNAARSVVVQNVDTNKMNYAAVAAVSQWGQSSSSPEIGFGGTPPPPFQLKAAPANP